jgi:parvulin-like peptidyl-prolyl isomerase
LAKKQKKIVTKRLPTKQQLSRWQRQKKMQRMIMIAGGIFLVIVIAIVGYGIYDARIKPFQQRVVKVNEAVVEMNDYLDMLTAYLKGVDVTQAPMVGEMVIEKIIQDELVLQNSPKLGVSMSDSDIEKQLIELKIPTGKIYKIDVGASLVHDKLMDTYFEQKVPTTAKQVNTQAMFLDSEEAANKILEKLAGGESFIRLAKEFSVEDTTKEKSGELGWLMEGLTDLANGKFSASKLNELVFTTALGTVSKATLDPSVTKNGGYWIFEVVERDTEKGNHIRGILLGSQTEANEAKTKVKSGTDFAELAKEKSQHLDSKSLGGDLGWKQKVQATDVIGKAAVDLPVKVLSDPIFDSVAKTKGGYWLVKIVEKSDNKEIEKSARDRLKVAAFDGWVQEVRKTSTVEQYLDDAQKSWAVNYTLKKIGTIK